MKQITIINHDQIIEQLSELLRQFDVKLNRYQTDVYMYVRENGFAELDTFVNVGGNSWLDDDHITIYSDCEHYDDIYDSFDTIESLCDAAGIQRDSKLIADMDWIEIRDYIKSNPILDQSLIDEYIACLPDMSDYHDRANVIFDYAIERLREYCELEVIIPGQSRPICCQ